MLRPVPNICNCVHIPMLAKPREEREKKAVDILGTLKRKFWLAARKLTICQFILKVTDTHQNMLVITGPLSHKLYLIATSINKKYYQTHNAGIICLLRSTFRSSEQIRRRNKTTEISQKEDEEEVGSGLSYVHQTTTL